MNHLLKFYLITLFCVALFDLRFDINDNRKLDKDELICFHLGIYSMSD